MSDNVYGTQNTVSSNYFKPYVLANATRLQKLEFMEGPGEPYLEITLIRDSDGCTLKDRVYEPKAKKAFKNKTLAESDNFLIQKLNTWIKELLTLHLPPEKVAKVSGTSFKQYMYSVIAALDPIITKTPNPYLFWWKPIKSNKGYTKMSTDVPGAFFKDIGQDISQVPLTFTKNDYKYQHITVSKESGPDESQESEQDPEIDDRYASSDNDVQDRY